MCWQDIINMILGAIIASVVGVVSSWVTEHHKERKLTKNKTKELLYLTDRLVASFKESQNILTKGIMGQKYIPIIKNKFFPANDYSIITKLLAILTDDFPEEIKEISDFVRTLRIFDDIANEYYTPDIDEGIKQAHLVAYETSLSDTETNKISLLLDKMGQYKIGFFKIRK